MAEQEQSTPVDGLNLVESSSFQPFGPGMCPIGCWEAGKKPETFPSEVATEGGEPPLDLNVKEILPFPVLGPGCCLVGSLEAGKKPPYPSTAGVPSSETEDQEQSTSSCDRTPVFQPGGCKPGTRGAGKKPEHYKPVAESEHPSHLEDIVPSSLDLGLGACLVGSLEAGKTLDSATPDKRKTRRNRRSKTSKTSDGSANKTTDGLFSMKTFAKIGASFGNMCIDSNSGEVNIPPNPAGSSNEPSLDPGGKVSKRAPRPKKKSVLKDLSGDNQPIPISIDSAAVVDSSVTPQSVKKKRSRPERSARQKFDSPIPVAMGETTPKSSPRHHRHRSHVAPGNAGEPFSDYLPEMVVQVGIENKRLIAGHIRINPKNFNEAYIASPDKGQDIMIEGLKNRNRALEGDEVIVQMNAVDEWRGKPGETQQKTATVVYIKHQVHPRVAVGFLKPMADKNPDVVLFSPRDSRVPRIRVPISSCPADFIANAKVYEKQLFLASITDWKGTKFAVGLVLDSMGPVGDLKAENTAILLENDLKTEPYSQEMYKFFPREPYTIVAEEIAKREDLRKSCIFTIDPATARDLDDAVSVEELENGNLRVGVHISDVSFFVEQGTEFDEEVADRATSTYLVDTVYHMLPRELCMLCSLLPGADKLAYSVFWEINSEARVVSHRFTRSVINSCVQLSYEHAQEMLDHPDKKWVADELPTIHGGYTPYDLSRVVNRLNQLAVVMRSRRFESGALRIDQPKLIFSLDKVTGKPTGFSSYVNKESHRLIEEFMLLANMTVAERIYTDFPRLAFLRSHLAPHPYLMEQLQRSMASYGVHLDVSSAGALQRTMKMYDGDDFPSQARMMVLYARCSKPMARAKYFCACGMDAEDFSHYALNVPLYTHFTSPIRRYPDVMVHRLLSASLGYTEPPSWEPDAVQMIASNCNKKKFAAKRAGEQSMEIYLSLYIGQAGQMLESAVVIDVKDRSFDVIICSMGITQRIYLNKIHVGSKHIQQDQVSKLQLTWLPTEEIPDTTVQTIEMFVIVTVVVSKVPGQLKVESNLVRPTISGKIFDKVKI